MQSVPMTTKVMSSNPVQGDVYSIQHYVFKFFSDLWQVGGLTFVQVFRFSPPIKLTDCRDITEILLKVALNTIAVPPVFILFISVVLGIIYMYKQIKHGFSYKYILF